jgi:hypothetical protein
MPIAPIIASEIDATGRLSTRRFHTFVAGKIGHDESDGGGPGVGVGAGFGKGVGAAVGAAVVAVGGGDVGGDAVMSAVEVGADVTCAVGVAVGEPDESASVVWLGLVAAAGFEARTWLGVRTPTPVDVDAVGPFSPFDSTGIGGGLARTTTTTKAVAALNHANAASRFPRSDMLPA